MSGETAETSGPSLRLVLVDHIDDVLREALLVDEPGVLFGPEGASVIYDHGELVKDDRPVLRDRDGESDWPPPQGDEGRPSVQ